MSEMELSYEELRCLESHFRQLQKEAVHRTLQETPGDMVLLLGKLVSSFRTADQLKSAKTEP